MSAVAPTLVIDDATGLDGLPNEFQAGETVTVTATPSGGTYDTIEYAWEIVSGGGSFENPTGPSVKYTAPPIDEVSPGGNTRAIILCTATVRGTGTRADAGTVATAQAEKSYRFYLAVAATKVRARRVTYIPGDVDRDTRAQLKVTARVRGTGIRALAGSTDMSMAVEDFTVTRVLRPMVAPSALQITNLGTIRESPHRVVATVIGGEYDTVDYAWSVVSGGGSFDDATAKSAIFTPAHITTGGSDVPVTIRCVATARGTGAAGANGRYSVGRAQVMAEESFIVTDHIDVVAPSLGLTDIPNFREGQMLVIPIAATVGGGTYDTIEYAWTIQKGGGSLNTNVGTQVVYTPPADISADAEITIRCVATARGTGDRADVDTSATVQAEETFTILTRNALAPILTLTEITSLREAQTAALTATPMAGQYDSIEYKWEILRGGGRLNRTDGPTVEYDPANISVHTEVAIRCTATVRGTGLLAEENTMDTSQAEAIFTVYATGLIAAPSLAVTDIDSIGRNQTASLTATPSGGQYDTIAYAWSLEKGTGTLDRTDGTTVVYRPPADALTNIEVTIRCVVTVRGTGTLAADGSNAMVQVDESFVVSVAGVAFRVAATAPSQFGKMASHDGRLYLASDALHTVDPLTGATTRIGNVVNFGLSENPRISGLASDGTDLFAIGADALYTINAGTGVATQVGSAVNFGVRGSLPDAEPFGGLEFHSGTLYGVFLYSAPDPDEPSDRITSTTLASISTTTGVATRSGDGVIEAKARGIYNGLASHNGHLYIIYNGNLWALNPATRASTRIRSVPSLVGIASHNGRLYAVDTDGILYTLGEILGLSVPDTLTTFTVDSAIVFGNNSTHGWVAARNWGSLVSAAASAQFVGRSGVTRTVNGIFELNANTIRISVSAGTPLSDMPDFIRIAQGGNIVTVGNPTNFANRGLGAQVDYSYVSGATLLAAFNPLGQSVVTLRYKESGTILRDATAPVAFTITDIASITEDQTAKLTAMPTGGTYDEVAYAWSVVGSGMLDRVDGATVVYTPADITGDTRITVRCVATFKGTGTRAVSGTDAVLRVEETFRVGALLDATAPDALAITDITSILETATARLTATPSGGIYDNISYAWSIQAGGGTLDRNNGPTVVYDPADVSANTPVTIRCVATVRGTGTRAKTRTSAVIQAEEMFMVTVLRDAAAPTLAVTDIASLGEQLTTRLAATPSDGRYDTIEYKWEIRAGGGMLDRTDGAVVVYDPADISVDTEVTIRCTATAKGTGTLAKDGTSATVRVDETFTVLTFNAVSPSLSINVPSRVQDIGVTEIAAVVAGMRYDTIEYAWELVSAAGSLNTMSGSSVAYSPPNVVSDTRVTIRCVATVKGTGVNAEAGTSATVRTESTFTVFDTGAGQRRRIGSAVQFGVGQNNAHGLTSHGTDMYMIGSAPIALYGLDPITSIATEVYPYGTDGIIAESIASHDGRLYLGVVRPTPSLYVVDPLAGAVTRIGPLVADPYGMTSHNGQLYIATLNALYTVDTATGATTRVGTAVNFGVSRHAPTSLASHNGTMYIEFADGIYTLDPTTGIAKLLAVRGPFPAYRGMTSHRGRFYGVDRDTLYGIGPVRATRAVAPTLALAHISIINKNQPATIEAVPSGGVYDIISYAWSIRAGGGTLNRLDGDRVVYTPDASLSEDTAVTIRCVATVRGGAETATVQAEETFTVTPSATAPALALTNIANIREDGKAIIAATPSGGGYDAIEYAWSIQAGGGKLDRMDGSRIVYTPADVSANTRVVIRCIATVRGTGTLAALNTSASVQTDEIFTVTTFDVIAPTLSIVARRGTGLTFRTVFATATITGGRYDTITYEWFAGSEKLDSAGRTASYEGSRGQGSVTIRCVATARGTGVNAQDGDSEETNRAETQIVIP